MPATEQFNILIDQHLATCEECFHLDADRVLAKNYTPGKCLELENLLSKWVTQLEVAWREAKKCP
jgi:hypothetical protein